MTTRYPFSTRADLGRACVDLSLPGAQAAVDANNTHLLETTGEKFIGTAPLWLQRDQ